MTILCVVHGIRASMFLAELSMLLDASFLGGDSGRRLSISSLVSFLALVGSFLVGLCIGFFLGTFMLNSFERHEKQTYVHGSHTFLVKVELILTPMWAHPSNVTHQISLCDWYVHGNCTELGAWVVEPARQLHNVGVELFYMLHKLTHADVLGFLEQFVM